MPISTASTNRPPALRWTGLSRLPHRGRGGGSIDESRRQRRREPAGHDGRGRVFVLPVRGEGAVAHGGEVEDHLTLALQLQDRVRVGARSDVGVV